MDKLAVLTVVENPLQWKSRYRNYDAFIDGIYDKAGVTVYTVEVAHASEEFKVTNSLMTYNHLQLRTNSDIWHKENALNLLLDKVREDYVAWVDADILFVRPDIAKVTIDLLQKYKVVQPFSHAQYLGSSYQPLGVPRPGYFYQYKTEGDIFGGVCFWGSKPKNMPRGKSANPGLACAMRKQTWKDLGGLIDWCIAGSGDFHMMAAFLGKLPQVIANEGGYTDSYIRKCYEYQQKCDEFVRGSVGYVPGLLCHYWHGAHAKRRHFAAEADSDIALASYRNMPRDCQFNPDTQLVKERNGLYTLINNKVLQAEISSNMQNRNEDELGEVLIP
jgi:hypothetical protein